MLLSTDYVPLAIVRSLEEIWGCRVFNHYGMTEMGPGGGVECDALDGYHVREADLYFEVADHKTGKVCPDGTLGEVSSQPLPEKACLSYVTEPVTSQGSFLSPALAGVLLGA